MHGLVRDFFFVLSPMMKGYFVQELNERFESYKDCKYLHKTTH